MKSLEFRIHYVTHPGQELKIQLNAADGDESGRRVLDMQLLNAAGGLWSLKLDVDAAETIRYRYFVQDHNFGTALAEWGPDRCLDFTRYQSAGIALYDRWRSPSDPEFTLHTSAFTGAIFPPHPTHKVPIDPLSKKKNTVRIRFSPEVIRIKPGHRVAVAGSARKLGKWDEAKALVLGNPQHPEWTGEIVADASEFPLYYKYLIKDENGDTLFWEKSADRVIDLPAGDFSGSIDVRGEVFDFPQYPWKGAGVAIPVFSLRRENGYGVGEFSDLRLLTDWAVRTGLKIIQILPINDTVARHSWHDSYPYAAISVYALHPMYINIEQIGRLKSTVNQEIIESRGRTLNSLDKIDYESVMLMKSRFFKQYFDENRGGILQDPDFKKFVEENSHWLTAYAAFSYLRDLYNTPDFSRWDEYAQATPGLIERLTDPGAAHFDDIAVHYFIQYHAFKQLGEAADYARSQGVALKGDIPIGIYRNSVDAWVHPELFHLDRQAGAPPDDFSDKGQNWRLPTYNWDEMAKDGYRWWQQRLQHQSRYFDAFRIDHILGFFRIWEIPASQVEGLMGYFNPSIPATLEELHGRGLWFDYDRLCKPYIREHFLYERFGELTQFVKENYLDEYAPGCYHLKSSVDNQSKIEKLLTPEPDASADARNRSERIIRGLYSLVGEVVFLEAPGSGGQAFFPRNALHFTRSYQELDEHNKHLINELYIDYFYRRNEEFWRGKAMQKLPAIKAATGMLLCGEDLGMVPACVPSVMNELGILSLEVQRMPKDPKITFGHPANYPYLSVATPSSHDTSTIRGWWEEDPARSQRFYSQILGNAGGSPFECTTEIVKQIIVQHLFAPSMWAIFPIQDFLGMDEKLRHPHPHAERINNPGNPSHYWRYRMHLSLEQLIGEEDFNGMIEQLITSAGRAEVY